MGIATRSYFSKASFMENAHQTLTKGKFIFLLSLSCSANAPKSYNRWPETTKLLCKNMLTHRFYYKMTCIKDIGFCIYLQQIVRALECILIAVKEIFLNCQNQNQNSKIYQPCDKC